MKNIITLVILLVCMNATAQNELYNNGAALYIGAGAALKVNGSFTNTATGTFNNNGTATITGNMTNHQVMSAYTGKIIFNSADAQTVSGANPVLTKDVEINNTSGVTLNTGLKVEGLVTFVSGIVNASNNTQPLTFTANATITGASHASHVNGFVSKEGTGGFIYPTGDGSRYQPVTINASANASGIRVKYNAANAGAGAFTGATPLQYYNTFEYWELTPLSTATGTVTIYWDDYNNVGIGNTADLRVAHLSGGNWLNEGVASVTGAISSGSVTSNTINTWSPFSLGSVSVNSTLPVSWLSITGSLNAQKQAIINWSVREQNVRNYQIEKSSDGRRFANISIFNSKGDGTNDYSYQGSDVLQNSTYYRIKQTDLDGQFMYSPVIRLSGQSLATLQVYPSPFTNELTIVSNKVQAVQLVNIEGQLVRILLLKKGGNYINVNNLNAGMYLIKTSDGIIKKVLKQ